MGASRPVGHRRQRLTRQPISPHWRLGAKRLVGIEVKARPNCDRPTPRTSGDGIISPVSWSEGPLEAYPITLTIGVLVGLLWLGLNDVPVKPADRQPGSRLPPIARVDAGLVALGTGLVGARLGFVLAHGEFFLEHPEEALQFWQGGLSWVGSALGALMGVGLYAVVSRRPFWSLADALALPAVLLAASAWTGCLIDACVYGRRADLGPLTPPGPDALGLRASRWPTQAMGAVFSLVAFLGLYRLTARRLHTGVLACLSLSLIAASNLALSFTRGDPTNMAAGMRLDALASGGILSLALISLVLRALHR